jgi:hypothetical protein
MRTRGRRRPTVPGGSRRLASPSPAPSLTTRSPSSSLPSFVPFSSQSLSISNPLSGADFSSTAAHKTTAPVPAGWPDCPRRDRLPHRRGRRVRQRSGSGEWRRAVPCPNTGVPRNSAVPSSPPLPDAQQPEVCGGGVRTLFLCRIDI